MEEQDLRNCYQATCNPEPVRMKPFWGGRNVRCKFPLLEWLDHAFPEGDTEQSSQAKLSILFIVMAILFRTNTLPNPRSKTSWKGGTPFSFDNHSSFGFRIPGCMQIKSQKFFFPVAFLFENKNL